MKIIITFFSLSALALTISILTICITNIINFMMIGKITPAMIESKDWIGILMLGAHLFYNTSRTCKNAESK